MASQIQPDDRPDDRKACFDALKRQYKEAGSKKQLQNNMLPKILDDRQSTSCHQDLQLDRQDEWQQERLQEAFNIRIHRAKSWCGRAEQERDDPDAGFLFLWIAFNAAYGICPQHQEIENEGQRRGDRQLYRVFFETMIDADSRQFIYDTIWGPLFSNPIRNLLDNRFVYEPYWQAVRRQDGSREWERYFKAERRRFHHAFKNKDTVTVLTILFSRLYVLRCQLVHGGATWNSKLNRDQVKDGRNILAVLIPQFITVMKAAPNADWGEISYPPHDTTEG